MTSKRRYPIAWFAALCLVLTLAQPVGLLAQDDDSDDDDDVSVPGGADDDNDDDTEFDDDGDDDDVPAPPPPPAPAPAVPAPDDDDDDRDDSLDREIPNEAIVQLAEGVEPNAFAGRNGATVLRVIPEPNIALLRLDPDEEDDAELRALRADPDLIWGEQNYTSQAPEGRPRYFFSSSTSEPQLVDGPALPEGLDFTPVGACVTGEDVVVAVLDTGVDTDHPALATNVLPNGVNMIENTFDVRDLPNGIDDNNDGQVDELVGHGTHVAGTVLQVAPDAAILPVKVLDSDGVGDTFS
ncbi:MAG: S8 family serine peptidase, partial [Chloroflexia bacterium]|nr:S8 family serine peptidase [Chloroflexia bacterium]